MFCRPILNWQTANERQFGRGPSTTAQEWSPSVILEGKVRRRIGTLQPGVQASAEPQYIEMYVHDALYTHRDVQADEPITIGTPRGFNIVLPKSASNPERERVAKLLDRFFNYVSTENVFVQQFVAAAEEISNMTAEDVEHTVLVLQG